MSGTLAFILSVDGQEPRVPEPGDNVPHFTAMDDQNQPWSLKKHLGKKFLVIYFYPAAMTGGCTRQACGYRDMISGFENADAEVIGISGDRVENLEFFKKANNLNFTLLSDHEGVIARKFGVPLGEGSTITREIDGVQVSLERGVTAKRWTFVISPGGKIIYLNREVDAGTDSQAVLEVIRKEQGR